MELKRIETPGISHYAYLIADGGEAAIVDPRRDIDDYLHEARKLGTRIKYVIETHRQEDFVMGSSYLAEQVDACIVNGEHELFGHGELRLKDGETFSIGALKVRALHTPGHTMESMCYAVYAPQNPNSPWCVFTGDTLFFGTTGRTDLPDKDKSVENAALLYESVHQKIASLGDNALLLPAHGPGSVCGSGMAERPYSTIGDEKEYNEVFTLSKEVFSQKKGGERLSRPPFFRYMEKVNLEGGIKPVISPGKVDLVHVAEFAEQSGGGLVFDAREPEAYAGGHIANSYSIWLGGLPVFGGWIANEESPVYIVTEQEHEIDAAAMHLSRIGVDNVQAGLAGGFGSWRSSGQEIKRAGTIAPRELAAKLEDYQVLDVREIDEYDAGHIPGAAHMFVGELEENLSKLNFDSERPVVVTCGVGHRAGIGVSILLRNGYQNVSNLLGGMSAWKKIKLPMKD
jgi:hydroxyacylglutathione hydrolase